jgi:chromosome segregation ATPase
MSIFPNPSPIPPEQPAPPTNPGPPTASWPPQAPPSGYAPTMQYAAPPPPPQYYAPPAPPESGKSALKTGLLIGALVLLAGTNLYLYNQTKDLRSELAKNSDALQARIDKLDEANSLTERANQKRVQELKDQLERARRQASLAAGDAKEEAIKKVEETRAQLQAAQQQAEQQLSSDISKVREQTDTVNSRVTQVNTDVSGVKTDLTSARSQLEKTVADLKRATGDIDGHSVLIATNAKELAALKALGERNFIEFNIKKAKQPQRVGDVSILLKNADFKKNKYTIELTADDKTTEKKDRGINEPVQFLTSKAKQPYELVVNDIKKDTIIGYLSVPKVQSVRN